MIGKYIFSCLAILGGGTTTYFLLGNKKQVKGEVQHNTSEVAVEYITKEEDSNEQICKTWEKGFEDDNHTKKLDPKECEELIKKILVNWKNPPQHLLRINEDLNDVLAKNFPNLLEDKFDAKVKKWWDSVEWWKAKGKNQKDLQCVKNNQAVNGEKKLKIMTKVEN